MKTLARTALGMSAVVLLFSACPEAMPSSTPDPATEEVPDAASGDQDDTSTGDEEPAGTSPSTTEATDHSVSVCMQTMHEEITVDGTTYPSFLWLRVIFEDSSFAAPFSVFGPDFNSGVEIDGQIRDGMAEAQLGIMAYGDYFFPEVVVGATTLDLPLEEPFTVDANQGEATESCLETIATF